MLKCILQGILMSWFIRKEENLMVTVPNIDEIKNCNKATVTLKTNHEKPVQINVHGIFEQVTDDGADLVIKTNSEYAVFKSRDVQAVHFSHN